MSSKSITLVIKIVERCNINCTYCYFFNGIDESYKKNPPYISKNTIKDIAVFIKIEIYGIYLCNLFQEWTKDPSINLRFFSSLLETFFYGKSRIYGVGPNDANDLPLMTISSKGDIGPVDELRSTDPKLFQTQLNVSHATLNEILSHPTFQYIKTAQATLPTLCKECCWSKVCYGGSLVNRYSMHNNFNNASVYCESLKHFYGEVAEYLLNNGLSYAKLEKLLCIN